MLCECVDIVVVVRVEVYHCHYRGTRDTCTISRGGDSCLSFLALVTMPVEFKPISACLYL